MGGSGCTYLEESKIGTAWRWHCCASQLAFCSSFSANTRCLFTLHGGFEGWINQFLQDGAAYPFFVPILQALVLPHAIPIAMIVAYGELAIGLSLVSGVVVRSASAFGAVYMLLLVFSSNFPGKQAPFWQYFGTSLDHSVLLLCFLSFMDGVTNSFRSTAFSIADWAVTAHGGTVELNSEDRLNQFLVYVFPGTFHRSNVQ